jgi:hypothetical protein
MDEAGPPADNPTRHLGLGVVIAIRLCCLLT